MSLIIPALNRFHMTETEVPTTSGAEQKTGNGGDIEAAGAPTDDGKKIDATIKTANKAALRAFTGSDPVNAPREAVKTNSFRIESIGAAEITPEMIREMSDYFRWIFITDFPEYVVCQDCGITKSADEIFGLEKGQHISLEAADNLKEFPDCPCCRKKMEFFHDPERTYKKLSEKIMEDTNVTVLYSNVDGKLEGLAFGYKATVEGIFEREWRYRFGYTKHPKEQYQRNRKKYLDEICSHLTAVCPPTDDNNCHSGITPESLAFCGGCLAISPEARKHGLSVDLFYAFLLSLDPETVENCGLIGEVMTDSMPHAILKKAGTATFNGILDSGFSIVAMRLKNLTEFYKELISGKKTA
jgi:hypothetical protein